MLCTEKGKRGIKALPQGRCAARYGVQVGAGTDPQLALLITALCEAAVLNVWSTAESTLCDFCLFFLFVLLLMGPLSIVRRLQGAQRAH